jgi:gliding motility-associated-like protein
MNILHTNIIKVLFIMNLHIRKIYLIFIIILLQSFISSASAQNILLKNDGIFYMNTGSIVKVLGGVLSDDTLTNYGTLNIENDFIIGEEGINIPLNQQTVRGNGDYYIGGNWINKSNFEAGTSNVHLVGLNENQFITGKKETYFYNLSLEGPKGYAKTLQRHAHILNKLYLNDNVLATDTNILFIENTDPLAIERTLGIDSGGYVSSRVCDTCSIPTEGFLARRTAYNEEYLFPTGASFNERHKYRPIKLKPETANPNMYYVRFVNKDPFFDNMSSIVVDTTICFANPNFYHRISHPVGIDKVNISIYFDTIMDLGKWDGIALWQKNNSWNAAPNTYWWTNMGLKFLNGSFSSPITNNYQFVTKAVWDFTPKIDNVILMANRPSPVLITGNAGICFGDPTIVDYYGTNENNYMIKWEIFGGKILSRDSTKNNLTVDWGNTIGGGRVLKATQLTGFGNCGSYTTSQYINVYPKPDPNFTIFKGEKINPEIEMNTDKISLTKLDTNAIFVNDLLSFVNKNYDNANPTFFWDFGDGGTSSHKNPYHIYEASGTYTLNFRIANEHACYADTSITIEVVDGLIYPNVFTPNGDGHNDIFYIKSSGMTEYNLQIYNRWGILIFETNDPNLGWDGKSLASENAPAGTYFYILKARTMNKSYNHTGFVTLIR